MPRKVTRKMTTMPATISVNGGPPREVLIEAMGLRVPEQAGKPPSRVVTKDYVVRDYPQAEGGPLRTVRGRHEVEREVYELTPEEQEESLARMERVSNEAYPGTESIFVRVRTQDGAKAIRAVAAEGSVKIHNDGVGEISIRYRLPDPHIIEQVGAMKRSRAGEQQSEIEDPQPSSQSA